MSFSTYLVRRLMHSILVLFGISILVFLIARVLPGDPARVALGPRAPEETVQRWREWMHLDEPLHVQYYYWLANAIHGDLGISLYSRQNVAIDIKTYFPATAELALFAGLIMTVFGVLFGAISARYSNTWVDNIVRIGSYVGVVTPAFIFGILFLLLFGLVLKILPTTGRLGYSTAAPPIITGMVTIDSLITVNFAAFLDALKHLLMPATALALGPMAQEARITRASMSDNLKKDYMLLVSAQGIPERLINFKYLLKPSLIPTVSILGLDFAALLGNAFLVELIFGWPGLSRYGIQTMLLSDLNAITGVVMVLGIVFTTVNILVDIVVAYLDPRIRLTGERLQ